MDTIYSEAFEHLPGRQVLAGRNTDAEENIKPALRKKSGASRTAAFKKKSNGSGRSNILQDESVGEYIDSSEINPRIPSPQHYQRSHSEVSMRNQNQLRQGHTDEDSQEYQYAYSAHPDIHIPPEQRKGPVKQRSVSLKDEYSVPPDRLSKSSGRPGSESQDYIEPYQSQGHVTEVVVPDTSGIYELAKDITPPPTQTTFPQRFEDSHSKHYSHLVSGATNQLQNTRIDEENENYDHLNTWKQRQLPAQSISRISGHQMKNAGSTTRQGSSTPEDFFPIRGGGSSVLPQSTYEDLPSEYHDPWDTEAGQKKLSRLMQRAEKTDDRRQSVDESPPSQVKHLQQADRYGLPKDTPDVQGGSASVKPAGQDNTNTNLYECAWEPPPVRDNQPGPERRPSVPPHRNKKAMVANYEDAWDTGDKQREFEEKLENIRKQRLSEGKINPKDLADSSAENNNMSVVTKDDPPTSPVSRYFEREQVSRSDSCKSLAALAEKVDKTIPLEDQCFYHGSIKRSDAERMLCVFKDGSYLIRRSESNRKDFSLTLKGWNGIPMHMKITSKPNGTYVLGENSPPFYTIPEMVEYYTKHELPVQDAARICLLYPIPS